MTFSLTRRRRLLIALVGLCIALSFAWQMALGNCPVP